MLEPQITAQTPSQSTVLLYQIPPILLPRSTFISTRKLPSRTGISAPTYKFYSNFNYVDFFYGKTRVEWGILNEGSAKIRSTKRLELKPIVRSVGVPSNSNLAWGGIWIWGFWGLVVRVRWEGRWSSWSLLRRTKMSTWIAIWLLI